MKVGILTFHNAPSYGAFFQAYALATFLKESGYSIEVVDYMPYHRRRSFGRRISFKHFGVNRSNVRWLEQVSRVGYNLRRRYVFAKAVRSLLPLTATRYTSLQQLQQDPPALDACVFGSDQVWNPSKTDGVYDAAYFGGFGPPEMRRVAYAASFGMEAPEDDTGDLPRLLNLLDSIFVREQSAVAAVHSYTRREAHCVVDPTFLIDPGSYPHARRPVKHKEYVLGYLLRPSERTATVLQRVASAMHVPAICLPPPPVWCRGLSYHAPVQMLELLRNARYVVTDSFHGLALAINHHVDFTSIGLTGRDSCLNTRMVELLASLDLAHRFLGPDGSPAEGGCERVDWGRVNSLLEPMRDKSRQLLLGALEKGGPSRAQA